MAIKRITLLLGTIMLTNAGATGQVLLEENFDYTSGTYLTVNGWTAHSGAGSTPIQVTSPGLSYTGYPSSGVGNAVTVTGGGGSREDAHRTFTAQTSGSAYASFLVNVAAGPSATNGDYFIHFGPQVISNIFRGRVFLKSANNGNLAFGVTIGTTTGVTFSDSIYATGIPYLVILKYEIIDGSDNDRASLFIYQSSVPDTEPSSPTVGPIAVESGVTEPTDIGSIALRQGSGSYSLVVDGIRIASSWHNAPLPVQLASFSVTVNRFDAALLWSTLSEVNNFGFEIERRTIQSVQTLNQEPSAFGGETWNLIGFVQGSGTSSSPKDYSFVDKHVSAGRYAYRLKQIDFGGSFTYSHSAEVEIGLAPKELTLRSNYPNPFNPTTMIEFTIPEDGHAALRVYNTLGQVIATLFDGQAAAGRMYQTTFDASQLPSGVYYSRLEYGSQSLMKRMVLVR
ncbi:MAG: T9SS type A sorting domain-containing protein [Ignavibacteriales bacterium]|nr:T9SS type A sorting domain-containing protein [Ignavibacteriales bacterium]